MAIYAVNRVNSDSNIAYSPCVARLRSQPRTTSGIPIRCSIPACPPCAGVHPWLRNEETESAIRASERPEDCGSA